MAEVAKEERHDLPWETKVKEEHKDHKERKEEKREKERQKEEKHEKKLKRSYTPDHDPTDATWEGREREHKAERSSSHTHHSPEASRCHSDERDVKRRKLDSPTGSKVSMMEMVNG